MKTAISLVALTFIATSAAAQTPKGALPPVEYDHPFVGELTVVTARDQDQVRAMCPNTKFPPIGALGCAPVITPERCQIVLAPDADIVAAGHVTEIVKRHEIGHCNGWPGDHKGARTIEEWATTLPKTDPNSCKPIPFTREGDCFVGKLLSGH